MPINLRRVGEVADGSVTAAKLADGAVITPKIANDAVDVTKIATNAVTSAKIADGAVGTTEIADGAISPAKVYDTIKSSLLVGDDTEVSVTGTSPSEEKNLRFVKSANLPSQKLYFSAEIKSNTSTYMATLTAFMDVEATARYTFTSTATTYELKESTVIDISDLSNGVHTLKIKLNSANVSGIASNALFEAHLLAG